MGLSMATDTARSSPPARHLWQVPTFLLGVAAAVAVVYVRPYFSAETGPAAEYHLREARKALDQADPAAALQQAGLVLAAADRHPQLAGEAHFLAGSAH